MKNGGRKQKQRNLTSQRQTVPAAIKKCQIDAGELRIREKLTRPIITNWFFGTDLNCPTVIRALNDRYGEEVQIDGVLPRSEFGFEIHVTVAFMVSMIGLSIDKVCTLLKFFRELELSKSQADALLSAYHFWGTSESLRLHLAEFTLESVLSEVQTWWHQSESLFDRLVTECGLDPPTDSKLKKLVPLKTA